MELYDAEARRGLAESRCSGFVLSASQPQKHSSVRLCETSVLLCVERFAASIVLLCTGLGCARNYQPTRHELAQLQWSDDQDVTETIERVEATA